MPMKSTDTIASFFSRDHDEIDAILEKVERGVPGKLAQFELFDRRLERHIRWEEELLFPAAERAEPSLADGPIAVMRVEHDHIRRLKRAVLEALRAGDEATARLNLDELRAILGGHNVKEERVLYPACDALIDPEKSSRLLERLAAEP